MNIFQKFMFEFRIGPLGALLNNAENKLKGAHQKLYQIINSKETPPAGEVTQCFHAIAQDAKIETALYRYGNMMTEDNFYLTYAGDVNRIFYMASMAVPPNEAELLADIILDSKVFTHAIRIDKGHAYGRDHAHVLRGLGNLLGKVEPERKISLYIAFDSAGILSEVFPYFADNNPAIAEFLKNYDKGMENKEGILASLKASPSWRNFPKDPRLSDFLKRKRSINPTYQ